jgi:hypothetical protein
LWLGPVRKWLEKVTQSWVMARLTAGSGLADSDPQWLVGASLAMKHIAQPIGQKPGKEKEEEEEDDGS